MRNNAIDASRGIAILLVLVGHTAAWQSPPVFKLIYSFHMPLFFVISGYVFKPRGIKESTVRAFQRLIIPYLIIGFSCALPSLLVGDLTTPMDFWRRVGGTLYSIPKSDWTFYCTPIWFLTCLFCTEVIYACIGDMSPARRWGIAIGSLFVGWWLFQHEKGYYPWNIQIALVGVFFYHLGVELRRIQVYEAEIPLRAALPLLAVCIAILVFANDLNPNGVNLAGMQSGPLMPFLASTIAGSAAVLVFGKILSKSQVLHMIGTHTVILFGYNYWIMRFGNYIALEQYGWIASLAIQAPFYIGLVWLSRKTGFLTPGGVKHARTNVPAGSTAGHA